MLYLKKLFSICQILEVSEVLFYEKLNEVIYCIIDTLFMMLGILRLECSFQICLHFVKRLVL